MHTCMNAHMYERTQMHCYVRHRRTPKQPSVGRYANYDIDTSALGLQGTCSISDTAMIADVRSILRLRRWTELT